MEEVVAAAVIAGAGGRGSGAVDRVALARPWHGASNAASLSNKTRHSSRQRREVARLLRLAVTFSFFASKRHRRHRRRPRA